MVHHKPKIKGFGHNYSESILCLGVKFRLSATLFAVGWTT